MTDMNPKQMTILQTAAALFARRGYFDTSMREIAAAANIAVGTTYLYYPTKEDLLKGIFEHSSQLLLEQINTVLPGDETSATRRLLAFFRESTEFAFAHPDQFVMIFSDFRRREVEFPQRILPQSFASYSDLLLSILVKGNAAGEFSCPVSPKFLLGLFGFWGGMVLRVVLDPQIDSAREKQEINDLVEHNLLRAVQKI
jgi:TetR/AcrR family transcriptional regulator, fatty acid metabolism regulator protein